MQYSVVNYKTALEDNELFRIDADFFRPDYLDSENKIRSHSWDYLGNLAEQIVNFGAYSLTNQIDYLDEGLPFLNVGDIKDNDIEIENAKKIDPKLSRTVLKKSLCKDGQVLLTIAGTIGNAAVAYDLPEGTNSNQAIANISIDRLSPFYLSVYLNSVFGKQQTARLTISSVQPNLLLTQVKKIKIYIPSILFQEIIEEIYMQAHQIKSQAKSFFAQAERFFLSELDLNEWQPTHQLAFVKNYSDTEQAERIDAEYFQPKYDELVNAIKSYKGGWDALGNLVNHKKCIEVGSDEYLTDGIPFVRVSNLSPFEITEEKYTSEELYSEISQHQPTKGEILLSKDATPSIAYYLNEEPHRMILSSGILRLKPQTEKLNNEFLTLVLNSLLTKEQAVRDCGGSVIAHWRPDQIEEVAIPILAVEKQAQVQKQVQKSFALRKQSKHLLECAKRAVEMAIEKNEQAAIKWLKEKGKIK